MPRPFILFIAIGLLSANLYGEEFDPKSLPAVKRAMDKATAEVARNRKAYGEANEKALREAREVISSEVDRLSKAGKLEEAVAARRFAEAFGERLVATVEGRFAPPNPAQVGAEAWNGHKYKVFKEAMTWHDAKKKCEAMGGHLVIISDGKEQQFVVQFLGRNELAVDNQQNKDYSAVWLGATEEAKEGAWVWVDGSPLNYSNWHVGNPKGLPGEHYPALGLHYGGAWDDRSPKDRFVKAFICEWDE